MLGVEWKYQALEDLASIYDYIEIFNPSAAKRLRELIIDSAEKLPLMPYLFRLGRAPSTREYVVHPNYIIVYAVGARQIDIVRVLHAKQQYPKN